MSVCAKMVRFTSSKDENVREQPLNCPITFLTLRGRGQRWENTEIVFLAVIPPQIVQFKQGQNVPP